MSVDYTLKPVKKLFNEIYVEDSTKSRVNQWIDVKSNGSFLLKIYLFSGKKLNFFIGLIELEMPLSEEPNLGLKLKILKESNWILINI